VPARTVPKLPLRATSTSRLQAPGWDGAKGYANGIKDEGRIRLVGGMVRLVERKGTKELPRALMPQAKQTFGKSSRVRGRRRARPGTIVRLTWFT